MAKEIRLPQFGMTMESGQVVRWLVTEDEFVSKDQPVLELQNDKAVVEFESPDSGYIRIVAQEGADLPVGELLAVLLDSPDEKYDPPNRK